MSDLPSSFNKVNDVEVSQDAPVTEALFVKLGSNDNYLKDNLDSEISARAAADTAINSDITNNIKGAGPIQTLTTLKSRVDSVIGVLRLFTSESLLPATFYQFAHDPQEITITLDTGNFVVQRIFFSGFVWTRVTIHDTGVPTASYAGVNGDYWWHNLYYQSTPGGGLFLGCQIFKGVTV